MGGWGLARPHQCGRPVAYCGCIQEAPVVRRRPNHVHAVFFHPCRRAFHEEGHHILARPASPCPAAHSRTHDCLLYSLHCIPLIPCRRALHTQRHHPPARPAEPGGAQPGARSYTSTACMRRRARTQPEQLSTVPSSHRCCGVLPSMSNQVFLPPFVRRSLTTSRRACTRMRRSGQQRRPTPCFTSAAPRRTQSGLWRVSPRGVEQREVSRRPCSGFLGRRVLRPGRG